MRWKSPKIRVFDRLVCAMSLVVVAAVEASGIPQDVDSEAWEIQSVRELMQQDIERSLQREPQRASASPATLDAVGGRHAPRLVALYGVGRALMAEVVIGTQGYLYMRGQAHPVGYANDPHVYQLRGMEGSCIELHKAQSAHSLCLRTMLGTRQP